MRIAVIGDGPASDLAVIVLNKARHRVLRLLPRKAEKSRASARHIHWIDPRLCAVADRIDAGLAADLRVTMEDQQIRIRRGADWATSTQPCLTRADLDRVLQKHARKIDCTRMRGVLPKCGSGRPVVGDTEVELVVDASGAARAGLALLPKGQCHLEEIGEPVRYETQTYRMRDPLPATLWADHAPDGVVFVQSQDRALTVTSGRAGNLPDHMSSLIPPEAEPGETIRYVAPPPRSARLSGVTTRHWAAFGDALVQVPPRSGFGILSLFQQGDILAEKLRADAAITGLGETLDAYAETVWMQAALV